MKPFYSLAGLISHANTLIDGIDVVSIDIFDTLLVRRVHDPDLVKPPVARFIAALARDRGVDTSWKEVQALRDGIETTHRTRNGREHPDHEANYDEFMPEMLQQVFGADYDDSLFERVADYEMEMEIALLSPRAELVSWIENLHRNGKKIVLISDIYLPAHYLKRLVAAKGLLDYVVDVVSSADTFRAKASGTGFDLVQEKHAIDKSRWLHIGDNIISDGARPRQQGIQSLVIHDVKEKQRKGISRLIHLLANHRHFWKGRNVLQFMMPLEGENEERPALFVDGHNLFGMIIGYFLHCLADQCKRKNIKRIYFCSREGWMFFECWKRMQPYLFADSPAPEASYLYVSRIALSTAACANEGLTATNARVALLPLQNKDFADVCRVYKLDMEPLCPALQQAGLAPDDEIIPALDDNEGVNPANPFSVLLHDAEFQREVKTQSREARSLVETYLESQGFFDHQDIALVDIGWLGTIQHYLNQSITHRETRPNIHGFLLAATRMGPYTGSEESHYEGLVFDQHKFNMAASYILTIKDILEEICRAPHPSVIDYELQEGQVKPVLRTPSDPAAQSEAEQSNYYAPLHDGVFESAERYAAAATILGYTPNHVRPWLNFYLISRLAFPSSREVKRIKHFSHQDDFAGKREIENKAEKAIVRHNETLWDAHPMTILLVPFTRLRHFYRHISRMLRLWT